MKKHLCHNGFNKLDLFWLIFATPPIKPVKDIGNEEQLSFITEDNSVHVT